MRLPKATLQKETHNFLIFNAQLKPNKIIKVNVKNYDIRDK